MRQRTMVPNHLLVLVMLTTLIASGQPQSSLLKPGDPLPPLAGQTLTSKQLDVTVTTDKGQSVLILSFSRAGGRDAQNWTQRLSKDFPQVPIYTVIFLESVPSLFRPVAISSIRREMPSSMQDRTIVLYRDESLWKQRLQANTGSSASVILLGPGSHIGWITPGPFADVLYQELSKRIRDAH
jgi:hypothetical protein